MKDSNKNRRFETVPPISLDCINAQVSSSKRIPAEAASRQIIKLLRKENPALLAFFIESAGELLADESIPEPLAVYMRSKMLVHYGVLYRIIRAQIQANEMNDAWLPAEDAQTEPNDQ